MADRKDSTCGSCPTFQDISLDDKGFEVRIGYHPGARMSPSLSDALAKDRKRSGGGSPNGPGAAGPGGAGPGGAGPGGRPGGAGPGTTGPGGAGTTGPGGAGTTGPGGVGPGGAGATPPGGAAGPGGAGTGPGAATRPANRPPTVKAACNPCTVEVGKTSTVSADGQDPDGDALTYQWRTALGSLATPTTRQSVWTAPMQVGPVPVTVTVNDGRGESASDTVTIEVIRPVKDVTFEDVHFDFNRFNLIPEALTLLDEAVAAMQANPSLQLDVEGHTCNIGTAEYNLALGERRANSVRDYLVSKGISASRLHVISYGEERPKYDNSREETRRLNRRAALVVKVSGRQP
jgi:outer membrane protein OmpA-like peptidoglycan-associated protein